MMTDITYGDTSRITSPPPLSFVFLCGGKGLRFVKETPHVKPTMNVLGRPMYVWTMESLVRGNFVGQHAHAPGLHDLIVVTNSGDERSKDVHRDIRRRYENFFARVSRFELPFDTEGPMDTALLAIKEQQDYHHNIGGGGGGGVWILDNDVVHDEATPFAFDSAEGDSDEKKDTVKIVVTDLREPLEENNTVAVEHGSPFLQAFRNVLRTSSSATIKSPYCHVSVDETRRKVTGVFEKRAHKDAPYVILGAYGFSTTRLFVSLHAREKEQRTDEEASLSSLVRRAVLDEDKLVEPVIVKKAYTMGTPEQMARCFSSGVLSLERSCPRLTWVFDLDETLVTLPDALNDYSTCLPYENVARLARRLHACGHRIVIHTARRMLSLRGDVSEIERQTRKVMEENLQIHGIPFDEIVFGKPYGDVYVDDKSVNPRAWTTQGWTRSDVGYGWDDIIYSDDWKRVCTNVSVNAKRKTCVKRCAYPGQLRAYEKYLSDAPDAIRGLIPRLHRVHHNGDLEMEWIDGVSLCALHTWGLMNRRTFSAALDTLSRFHGTHLQQQQQKEEPTPPRDLCMLNYLPKLRRRLDEHATGFFGNLLGLRPDELDSVYGTLHAFFETYVPQPRAVIHGDFWMGNLVWDRSARRVRALDMRGALGDVACMGGDCAYDFAKLYQSLAGFDDLLCSPSTMDEREAEEDEELEPQPREEDGLMIDMLEAHAFEETSGAVDIYQIHMITCALVFGCAMFHVDSVRTRPRAWKRFLLGMVGERRHAMRERAQVFRERRTTVLQKPERRGKRKAALVLRGIARHSSYVHHTGKRVEIDFRTPAQSIKHNVVRDLENEFGCDVDTFLVTYANLSAEDEAELVGAYLPKNGHVHYMRCNPEESNQRDLFKHALRVVMDEADPASSLVVVLRFDLEMKTPLSKLSVDENVINFLWRERPLNAPSNMPREINCDGRVVMGSRAKTPAPNNPPPSRPTFGPLERRRRNAAASAVISTRQQPDHHPHPRSSSAPQNEEEKKNTDSGKSATPVCDVLQIFPYHLTDLVYEAACRLATPTKLHGLMGPICHVFHARTRAATTDGGASSLPPPINFLLGDDDRYHESNTDVCPNPIYRIVRGASAQMVPGHTAHFWKKLLGSNWRRI